MFRECLSNSTCVRIGGIAHFGDRTVHMRATNIPVLFADPPIAHDVTRVDRARNRFQ